MRLRKNILPKTMKEALSTAFVIVNIPIYCYLELFVVLPSFYEKWCPDYNLQFIIISTITLLGTANLIATLVVDPSIKGRIPKGKIVPEWKYCEKCDTSVPPRSWHCKICKICILRRDHHCLFMGCCVGLDNQKYFFMYIFYQMLCGVYGTYLNIFYLWNSIAPGCLWKSMLKVFFPVIGVFFMEWSIYQFHVFIILILFIVGLMASFLFIWYMRLLFKNLTLFENKKLKINIYDRGILDNIKTVLGNKWYIVWLGPWVDSKLPCDELEYKFVVEK